ncbi:MAG: hypothetical protein JKY81_06895 [Colwellia sp.]|nr:hypothetical protein [Colwellia sp.]
MDKELKQKIALVLIALLLIVKFVFLPQMATQDELVAKINDIKTINAKYEYLLSQKEKLATFNSQASTVELSINKHIPIFVTQAGFLLQTQKNIEAAIGKYNITSKRFIWFNDDGEPIIEKLYKKRIRIVLTGNGKNFLKFHTWLKENEPKYRLESFSLNLGKKSKQSMGWFDATVIIAAYYNQGVNNENN